MTDNEWKARSGIEKTLAAVAHAGDARKADVYAECFAEEGVLDLTGGGGETYNGRETIRAWMNAPSPIPQDPGKSAGFISHHLTSCRIDVTSPDTAAARTYWLVTSPVGLDHNGYYDDRFVKVGGDWLLAYRKPRTLWFAPDSLVRG